MIMEDYVSFETAKLLRNKGFNESCNLIYLPEGVIYQNVCSSTNKDEEDDDFSCLCPTYQMTLKWLREKYNIYITIGMHFYTKNGIITVKFQGLVTSIAMNGKLKEIGELTTNYQEATEAAIKYCLENLI